ncbi:MAG: hypothetical protein M1833_006630 [Piccolia ochrophora]|nr:MAG: hypothetical protein M1833_006630 [Piccolia ochrophora]
MGDLIREAPLGQIIRFVTRNRLLKYPEEEEAFELPTSYLHPDGASLGQEEKPSAALYSSSKTSSEKGRHDDDVEAHKVQQIPTHVSSVRGSPSVALARTKTRESTAPYSEERFEVEREEALDRAKSRPIVPQKTSEGDILVTWYTTDDPANPQNWSTRKKAYVVLQIVLYTFVVYCSSAIYVPSQGGVMKVFGVSQAKASLGLSVYVIGYGLGPLLFSPLSEIDKFGRNLPYIVTFGLFVIMTVPLALVQNYAGLLVLRFLLGFLGSPCLATGGASMQDLYSITKLPYALSAWVASAFCAPALGPLISAFAVTAKGWRWSLWETLWMSAPVFLLMFLTLPETYAPNILLRRARRLRALTGRNDFRAQSEIDQGKIKFSAVLFDSLIKPMQITVLDPAIAFTNLYTSLIYGIYYSFFEVFPLVYGPIYGFNLGETSVVFVCILVACVLGVCIYCSYIYFYLEPDILANGLRVQEHRLVPALFAVFLMPASLFIFGWTSRESVHWIVSVIGLTLYGVGAFIFYPKYAASIFAGNDACRSALAAGAIIFAHPLFVNLGIGPGISLLAGLNCGGIMGIFVLYYYGATLRSKSKFAQG